MFCHNPKFWTFDIVGFVLMIALYEPNFMPIHPIVAETFHSGPRGDKLATMANKLVPWGGKGPKLLQPVPV